MKLQLAMDKSAIGISFLCLAHCLLLPVLAIVVPTVLALPLADELFHKVLLLIVVPISALALFLGCKQHKEWKVLAWGISGLLVLIFTGLFAHDLVGEVGEKILTAVGSAMLIVCHYKNFRLCGKHQACACD